MWIFSKHDCWMHHSEADFPAVVDMLLTPVCNRKSTFFNVLTKSQASAENFPFCTIDPNESRVPVPDERFDFLCQYHKPARFVYFCVS